MQSPNSGIYNFLNNRNKTSNQNTLNESLYLGNNKPKYNPDLNYFSNTLERKNKIDLNLEFVYHPTNTFLIKVEGNSMIKAGINCGDILLVDREIQVENNKIIVASINDKLCVKRFYQENKKIILKSANDNYTDISIKENDIFNIWGIVTNVIKNF